MVMQGETQGLYWFGPNVPTSSSGHLCSCIQFAVGGYKRAREGRAPKSLGMCACVSNGSDRIGSLSARATPSPFYNSREREGVSSKGEQNKARGKSRGSDEV